MVKKILLIIGLLLSFNTFALDPRYGDTITRDNRGVIVRSQKVLQEFRSIHACPATGKHTGSCPGWEIDHVIPLACKGKDEVFNLQWLPKEIKSAAGTLPKDRWERRVYCK